jgi:hypothetical protein
MGKYDFPQEPDFGFKNLVQFSELLILSLGSKPNTLIFADTLLLLLQGLPKLESLTLRLGLRPTTAPVAFSVAPSLKHLSAYIASFVVLEA